MAVFSIYQFFGRYFGNLNKRSRYLLFQSLIGDGKIKFLIENTTVTVFTQRFDSSIVVIFEIIYGDMVI